MIQDGIRRLATLRTIDRVAKHPNADALALALIGGWQCVVKLGEFKEGDQCIYIEVDSMLPDGNPAWQFLVDKSSKITPDGKRARLRTIRLRGEYSQGLALPLSAFEGQNLSFDGDKSLDDQLNIIKYEPELVQGAALQGNARGSYPTWLPKTDLERIENCFNDAQNLGEHVVWMIEEKYEGSSCTVYSDAGQLGITSRNVDFKLDDENTFNTTVYAQKLDKIAEVADRLGIRQIAIRGELCGPSIQGNIYKLPAPRIFIFDIYNGDAGRYMTYNERQHALQLLKEVGADVDTVPLIGEMQLPSTVGEVISLADGASHLRPEQLREGLSWKTRDVQYSRFGNPMIFSFKSVSREYLAREK